jgi:hypothetical protein
MSWQKKNITEKLCPITDYRMKCLRESWYHGSQTQKSYKEFTEKASEWFGSSRVNDLQGWTSLPCIDVTMGCTHYIENFILSQGWHGFQILKNEYAYYTLMGKHGVEIDQLETNKPLIITMPHWQFCDLRPEWTDLLKICEQRNIDIHIDMAWIITAKDISIDFSHPCIKSVGMSLSKLNLQWSRVGLRFSRQKTMDSITIFNDYYQDTNTVLTSIGAYWIDNFDRDYLWNTYGQDHQNLCQSLDLIPTKIIHVAQDLQTNKSLGIGRMLGQSAPDSI